MHKLAVVTSSLNTIIKIFRNITIFDREFLIDDFWKVLNNNALFESKQDLTGSNCRSKYISIIFVQQSCKREMEVVLQESRNRRRDAKSEQEREREREDWLNGGQYYIGLLPRRLFQHCRGNEAPVFQLMANTWSLHRWQSLVESRWRRRQWWTNRDHSIFPSIRSNHVYATVGDNGTWNSDYHYRSSLPIQLFKILFSRVRK